VVPAPLSVYAAIAKLPPGHLASIPLPFAPGAPLLPASQPWWSLSAVIEAGNAAPFSSEPEALAALASSLSQAVAEQAIADVPLGAFLSGGIDSSLINALLQAQSSRPVRTFTIVFA
jgi:asparagine synthase (glutamine-hydrolysing)